ncbi:MAG: hypothetical protein OSA97_07270, partial [Nevskia sp.]|nr:hypothetical protein [Nevskia sp.]
MPLLQIFSKSPEQVFQLGLPQVIALCGSGQLSDGSACAEELRTFLRQAPSAKLFTYAEACLAKSFDKSGL